MGHKRRAVKNHRNGRYAVKGHQWFTMRKVQKPTRRIQQSDVGCNDEGTTVPARVCVALTNHCCDIAVHLHTQLGVALKLALAERAHSYRYFERVISP